MEKFERGDEVLSKYFETLKSDAQISREMREKICELWNQNKLKTKTHLTRMLDELRSNAVHE